MAGYEHILEADRTTQASFFNEDDSARSGGASALMQELKSEREGRRGILECLRTHKVEE